MIETNTICKLVNTKFTKKAWFIDTYGERITPKFKVIATTSERDVVVMNTTLGDIVYHITRRKVLYFTSQIGSIDLINLSGGYGIKVQGSLRYEALYNDEGERVFEDAQDIISNSEEEIAIKINNKWGLLDDCLTWRVKPMFDQFVRTNEYGYITVVEGETNQVFIINSEGKTVINLDSCEDAGFITKDYIKVRSNGKYGVIDITGKVIIPSQYSMVAYSDGFFTVEDGKKYGLYDETGRVLLECKYSSILRLHDRFVAKRIITEDVMI